MPPSLNRAAGAGPWWWDAVFYRIDTHSFADADGDGVGDLDGLRLRLGYLELLGVDAITVSRAVPDSEHDSFPQVVTEAHEAGIRIVIEVDRERSKNDLRTALSRWMERGVDGFYLAPGDDSPDAVRAAVEAYPDRVLVGDGNDAWHLGFSLDLAAAGFDADTVHATIDQVMSTSKARPGWALADHSSAAPVTMHGGGESGLSRARAMVLVQLALPGAVFLRHGEELGLPGTDPMPMPWEGSRPPFGFSDVEGVWPSIPDTWAGSTVEAQVEDPRSMLSLYRQALETRNTHPSFTGDEVEWFGAPEGCCAFRRVGSNLICALNSSNSVVPVPPGEVLLSSGPMSDGLLSPNAAVWLLE